MTVENSEVVLSVRELTAEVGAGRQGVTLRLRRGETMRLWDRLALGKSTFSAVLAGHPAYEVTGGEVIFRAGNRC